MAGTRNKRLIHIIFVCLCRWMFGIISWHSGLLPSARNCQLGFITTYLKQNETQSARAESTHKGVNQRSKYAAQVQQRPESPTVTLTWHACKYKIHKLHQRCSLMELMYLVFTRMPGESYRRRLRSLLYPLVEFMYLVFTRMPGESYRRRLMSLFHLCCVSSAD